MMYHSASWILGLYLLKAIGAVAPSPFVSTHCHATVVSSPCAAYVTSSGRCCRFTTEKRIVRAYCSGGGLGKAAKEDVKQSKEADEHHKKTYRTCPVCHHTYCEEENHPEACRYHPGRWMGAENAKHYGTRSGGKNTGLSMFWDCCDGETFDSPGCSTAAHKPYE